jgi:aldose 1-epimerase
MNRPLRFTVAALLTALTLSACTQSPSGTSASNPLSPSTGPLVGNLFGYTSNNEPVYQYTLTNAKGSRASFINYGAICTNLFVPDKDGKLGDVVLGYDTVREYELSIPSMCCVVGRFANRIGNASFTIDDHRYAVTANQGLNCLHGGLKGLGKRLWNGDMGMSPDGPSVRFTILDPDGAEGFPGNLNVTVIYTLTNDDTLKMQFLATTDKATPVNFSQHAYFNLDGEQKNDVLGYVVQFNADGYLPVDSGLVPTGQIASVVGTPFDFTKPKLIGRDLQQGLPGKPPGYDHTLVLDNPDGKLIKAAAVYDPVSGRMFECLTTEPAIHFTNARNLAGIHGKNGVEYSPYRGFTLETQHYSDSPNHPNFPNTILRPGETYHQLSEYKFSIPAKPLQPE